MTAETVTWLLVARFDAPVDLNDDALVNKIDEVIEAAGCDSADEIIGNLSGPANGSLDDAFDAARGYLQAVIKR